MDAHAHTDTHPHRINFISSNGLTWLTPLSFRQGGGLGCGDERSDHLCRPGDGDEAAGEREQRRGKPRLLVILRSLSVHATTPDWGESNHQPTLGDGRKSRLQP